MAKKKNDEPKVYKEHPSVDRRITDTLRENYMPYAMSVIVSRAIPEIDGFKPSHRKLLYTMYKMGLLNGNRTKSANIVGQTMKLNPHGDAAIYETMVRLTRGNEALLTPFVDSKGNFGKVYSRDMAYAAPRYTEAKLDGICAELFRDIDTDAVDFVDNYDGEIKEPTLLPTTFPNILVSANTGIAVGMASNFCGFNLEEVCRTTIECIKNPEHDILSTMPAPDFTTGGELIYDEGEMRAIYESGRGSFKVRAKWQYDKKENLIEVTEIPYTTTIEAIIDKIAELVKTGKMSEMNTLSGCQYDYPEILEYLKEADIISIQMGSNDAFVPTVVAIGNATNWKSEDLASIVLSGNLRSKDPETRAAFQASMKKLKLTKSETDAVWNLVTSGMNKICTDAYPVSTANIRSVVETVRALNPDAQILLIGATNPVPLLPSWSNYFNKLNKFQKQLAEVYDIDYVAVPYAQTELDGHPTVSGHKYIAKKIVKAIQNG